MVSIMLKEMHIDDFRTFCENKLDVMEQVRELFDAAIVICGPVNLEQLNNCKTYCLCINVLDSQSHRELLYKGDRSADAQFIVVFVRVYVISVQIILVKTAHEKLSFPV